MTNRVNTSRKCSGWCAPTIIYIGFAVAGTLFSLFTSDKFDQRFAGGMNKAEIFLVHLIMGLIWTGVLWWLCSSCQYTAAWVVLLLPLVLVIILIVFLLVIIASHPQGRYRRDHRGRLVLENVDTPLGAPEVRRVRYRY